MLDNQKYKNQYIKSCQLSNKKKLQEYGRKRKVVNGQMSSGLWVHNKTRLLRSRVES